MGSVLKSTKTHCWQKFYFLKEEFVTRTERLLHGGVIGPTATVAKLASANFAGLNLISVWYLLKDREPVIFQ